MAKRSGQSELIFNILKILRRKGEVSGEMEFISSLKNEGIGISPKRLRRTIYEIPEIEISIKYSRKKMNISGQCPICGSKLTPVRNMTLEGKRKVVGYRCNLCGFNSSRDGKPLIYMFRLKNHDL
jgi:predicted RNA-binding Zn-ribbon protein involved in translation (DUF1610 family)